MPVRVKFEADTGGLQKGIASAQASLQSFGQNGAASLGAVGKALGAMGPAGLAAAAAVGVVAGAFAVLGKATVDAVSNLVKVGSALSDLSAQSGVGVEALQKLGFAAKMVGGSAEDIAQSMKMMGKELMAGGTAFGQLGLSISKLKSMAPEQQFLAVTKAISGLKSASDQNAAAIEIFGRGASTALKMMRSDTEGAMKRFEDLGLVISEGTVGAADALGDELDTLGEAWDGLGNQIAAVIVNNPEVLAGFQDITNALGDAGKWVHENREGFDEFFTGVVALTGKTVDALREMYSILQSIGNAVTSVIPDSMKSMVTGGGLAGMFGLSQVKRPGESVFGGGGSGYNPFDPKLLSGGGGSFSTKEQLKSDAEAAKALEEAYKRLSEGMKAYFKEVGDVRAQHELAQSFSDLGKSTFEVGAALLRLQQQWANLNDEMEPTNTQLEAYHQGLLKIIADAEVGSVAFREAALALGQLSAQQAMASGGGSGLQDNSPQAVAYWLNGIPYEKLSDIPNDLDEAASSTADWAEAAFQVASIFAQMPGILGAIGNAIGGFAQTTKQMQSIMGGKKFGELGTAGKAQAGIAAGSTLIDIFKEGQMANSGGGAALSGAGKGAAVGGAIVPGWGHAIGAVVGAVAGLIGYMKRPEWRKAMQDIGKQYGFDISEGLAKSIEAAMKKFDIGRKLAETLNIGDIMKEGMAAGKDSSVFMPQVMELIKAVGDKSLPLKEGVLQIGEAFSLLAEEAAKAGDMASQSMLDMIKAAREAGIKIPEIQAYVKEQIQSAIEGVAKFVHAVDLTSVAGRPGERAVDHPNGFGSDVTTGAQQAGNDAATIFSATFWAAVAELGLVQAAVAMGPAFQELKKKIKEAGLEMPEALSGLNHIFKLMENPDFRSAMEALDGLGQALKGMTNAGYLTQDMFDAVDRSAQNAFHSAIKAGASESEAFQAVAPFIQQILSMHDKYGTAIPKWVQDLMAKHPEIKFETDPLEKVVDLLTQIAEALGAIPPEVNTDINVTTHGLNDGPLTGGPGTGGGSGGGGNGGLPDSPTPPGGPPHGGYADGGISYGPKSGHYELLHGREAIVPLDRPADGLPKDFKIGGGTTNNIVVRVDGGDPDHIVRVIQRRMRNGELTASTRNYAAR